jgi:hypothetical protein
MDGIATHFFIVYEIEVARTNRGIVVNGGKSARIVDWSPSPADLKPTQYRYAVPQELLTPVALEWAGNRRK